MSVNFIRVLITIFNFALLFAIIVVIIKAIQGFRNFMSKNKEMDKKLDSILNKLDNDEIN